MGDDELDYEDFTNIPTVPKLLSKEVAKRNSSEFIRRTMSYSNKNANHNL